MKFKKYKFLLLFALLLTAIKSQASSSVFDILDNTDKKQSGAQSENNNYRFSEATNNGTPAPILQPDFTNKVKAPAGSNNLQVMLDKIKSKVTNPFLKDNFTLDHIANFFANFVSGNQFVNNLEVKDLADINKLEIKESLNVKNDAKVENLTFNKLNSRALTIDDNEITFDPEALLKLKSSKISFRVKDIFEVITFMKYIVKICGSKLERCDFNTLLQNRTANQLMQLLATFEKKQTAFLDGEKAKIKKLTETLKVNQPSEPKKEKVQQKKKLRTEEPLPSFIQKDIEKEFNAQMKMSQSSSLVDSNDDYEKFVQNPQLADMINNYYYG